MASPSDLLMVMGWSSLNWTLSFRSGWWWQYWVEKSYSFTIGCAQVHPMNLSSYMPPSTHKLTDCPLGHNRSGQVKEDDILIPAPSKYQYEPLAHLNCSPVHILIPASYIYQCKPPPYIFTSTLHV